MSDEVYLLDYGAGNVRSVRNAISFLGFTPIDIVSPEHLLSLPEDAKVIFPGVGHFSSAMAFLNSKHNANQDDNLSFAEALRQYISEDRYFLGICLGMQCLFEFSEEGDGPGLGIIPGKVSHFASTLNNEVSDFKLSVPHIGWNTIVHEKTTELLEGIDPNERVYFVHSFCAAEISVHNQDWILTKTTYGKDFISSVGQGKVFATQFHPEKSGKVGLKILQNFLMLGSTVKGNKRIDLGINSILHDNCGSGLSKRIIACLDVRRDEQNKLVVTKGDGYDVVHNNRIRNMGDPVEMAEQYFNDGCDELSFLSIMSWNENTHGDTSLHSLLESVSKKVFVPLSIGGGIRSYSFTDSKTNEEIKVSALEIAAKYFRSGADKVSIGSDAVLAVQRYMENGCKRDGSSSIEQISYGYGCQAVVVSVDPKRIYFERGSEEEAHHISKGRKIFSNNDTNENLFVYMATTSGGKKISEVDVVQLVKGVEALGAGEILLNSIDFDGKKNGFDIGLVNAVCENTTLPVIASSGAGKVEHFSEVFEKSRCEAALAAGMLHRKECTIQQIKQHLVEENVPTRI